MQKTAYEMRISDWSSDLCSSDLGKVTLRSAPAGTGIIAGGPMRAVFESLGAADVVTKSVGTSNPYNMIRATFSALGEPTSPKSVAQRRGKTVAHMILSGGASESVAQAEAEAVDRQRTRLNS